MAVSPVGPRSADRAPARVRRRGAQATPPRPRPTSGLMPAPSCSRSSTPHTSSPLNPTQWEEQMSAPRHTVVRGPRPSPRSCSPLQANTSSCAGMLANPAVAFQSCTFVHSTVELEPTARSRLVVSQTSRADTSGVASRRSPVSWLARRTQRRYTSTGRDAGGWGLSLQGREGEVEAMNVVHTSIWLRPSIVSTDRSSRHASASIAETSRGDR